MDSIVKAIADRCSIHVPKDVIHKVLKPDVTMESIRMFVRVFCIPKLPCDQNNDFGLDSTAHLEIDLITGLGILFLVVGSVILMAVIRRGIRKRRQMPLGNNADVESAVAETSDVNGLSKPRMERKEVTPVLTDIKARNSPRRRISFKIKLRRNCKKCEKTKSRNKNLSKCTKN